MNKFLPSLSVLAVMALGVEAHADTSKINWQEHNITDRGEGEALFFECSSLINDAMRLACYDSLAQGQVPSFIAPKRQIELSSTLKSTVSGNRQVVYAAEDSKQAQPISSNDTKALQTAADRYTPLSLAFDLDRNNTGLWSARPHNPMYILPLYFNANPNRHPSTPSQEQVDYNQHQMQIPELKFQLSVKAKAAENLLGTDADLWVGYTQQSHWQVYNENNSRPFRAHDYQPEVFVTQPVKADLPFGGQLRMLGAGLVHHSNGEKDPLSRSWNRAYVMAGMEWDKLTVMPRLWARVADGEGKGKKNDNPDIMDYYGYGDVKFLYQLNSGGNISGTARYNPGSNRGALQLDYVHPIDKGISTYVQLFQGYGQSLIDYNKKTTGIGIGVMLNDWMGL
ncbi:phospholipase A [Moraxella nasicaprae]|uniref:Phospholipase A1 n=1 Tax=Moraxella nasicaprae TaxID=2904122 RepID=A0ABY6F625_9GAMM|nr:phospholipase A [Moraxella nasicaprae]UXZ05402.1 phospholipase A [Moraxella nasicaprae]